jgi:hypothetical protein
MKAILSTEKVAYSDLLKQEADMIAAFGRKQAQSDRDEGDTIDSTEFENTTKDAMTPLLPAEWDINDSEMEVLLKSKCFQ